MDFTSYVTDQRRIYWGERNGGPFPNFLQPLSFLQSPYKQAVSVLASDPQNLKYHS